LVTNVAFADAVPLDCGVKVTVNVAVPPAGIVSGTEGPVMVNSALLTEAELTVTLEPVALRVVVRLLFAPTTTLPKLRLLGLTANWPTATPVPDRETEGAEPDASDTMAMLPLAAPAALGVNVTPKVKLCPAVSVIGVLSPLMLKADPVRLT
jgi:hypothetical protein